MTDHTGRATAPRPAMQLASMLKPRAEPEIQWPAYDRIRPAVYSAYCSWAKAYRDPGFKRWTCLLRFDVLSDDLMQVVARVPFWMNLGSGEKPHAGRRKRYFREWVRANGEPPKRKDRLSPKVFVRRMARIEIGDTEGLSPYSVAKRILSWETGTAVITQSASHTVKNGKG